jgi:hypothetical protein
LESLDRYRRNGIDMGARDYDGRSCLDIARDDGNRMLVRFLEEGQANEAEEVSL